MEDKKTQADVVRERLERERQETVAKAVRDFAAEMTSYSVALTEEEAEKKWGTHWGTVITELRRAGFYVDSELIERRTGFLGLKKEMYQKFTISVYK